MENLQAKDIFIIASAVIAILGVFATIIAFLWYKISDERKQRRSVQESDEFKAKDQALNGYKQLYEVTLVHKQNLELELTETRKKLTEAERRITSLVDNVIALNERLDVLEKHSLTPKKVEE